MPKPHTDKPHSNKPKTHKPYRTARGVSHGMAERPQRAFDVLATLDPKLARTAGFPLLV